jgi:hypothetical protein
MTRSTALACLLAAGLFAATLAAEGKPAKPKSKPPAPSKPGPAPVEAAAPTGIAVTVVEVAGNRVYVQPGTTGGVQRGASISIRGKEYPVVEASDSYAVLEVGDEALHEQDKGRAAQVAPTEEKAAELPPPRPLAKWQDAWTEEAAPANAQEPRYVPLGGEERSRRLDVRFSVAAGGLIPLRGQVGSSLAMGELNARVHAEPLAAPLALDLDASLQGWAAADLATRVGGPTRPILFVRELLARYAIGNFTAGLGRMRYAASTLGALDGARLQQGLGSGFSLGAFGGLLPNPLSGAPSLDAQRFGVEARYTRPDAAWRPEAALVAQGSTFGGRLDERRLSGLFSFYPGASRFGGYFEVSGYDANNPWKASTVELTAAGLDQSVRFGSVEIGARADVRQPEQSRWLATFLPASWFCTTVPAPGSSPVQPEPCDGHVSTRGFAELDASLQTDHFSLALGGLAVRDLTRSSDPDMVGGFGTARILRIARALRAEISGNYSHSTYVDMSGGTAGPGLTLLGDALDVSAYYRLSLLQYRSVSSRLLQDGVGGTIVVIPSSDLLFTLQGEGITGDDAKALMIMGTATWRPRL